MLVLASASPRRRELLTQAGFAFEVVAADIPEEPLAGEEPVAYVTRLALEKALAVFASLRRRATADSSSRLKSGSVQDDSGLIDGVAVLGADTTVVVDDEILGKPLDAADAGRMLRMLSGRTHRVITGVALVSSARSEVAAEETAVTFAAISDEEIAAYIATGEPMDKAGAYAIQGRAARWIPRIEGDYSNVVGLPLARVAGMLKGFGVVS